MPKLFEKGQQPAQVSRAEARAKLEFFIQRALDLTPAIEQVATYLQIAREAAAAGDHAGVHQAAHAASKQLYLVSHCITDVSILASTLKLDPDESAEPQEKIS